MRQISHPRAFTPFGTFMHQYCDPSETGLIVNNVDYIIHNYIKRRIMIFEEKMFGERVRYAQSETLKQMDAMLRAGATPAQMHYEGIFVLTLPEGCTYPGPGMKLNGILITVEQLVEHINFAIMAAPPINRMIRGQQTFDLAMRKEIINGGA